MKIGIDDTCIKIWNKSEPPPCIQIKEALWKTDRLPHYYRKTLKLTKLVFNFFLIFNRICIETQIFSIITLRTSRLKPWFQKWFKSILREDITSLNIVAEFSFLQTQLWSRIYVVDAPLPIQPLLGDGRRYLLWLYRHFSRFHETYPVKFIDRKHCDWMSKRRSQSTWLTQLYPS